MVDYNTEDIGPTFNEYLTDLVAFVPNSSLGRKNETSFTYSLSAKAQGVTILSKPRRSINVQLKNVFPEAYYK